MLLGCLRVFLALVLVGFGFACLVGYWFVVLPINSVDHYAAVYRCVVITCLFYSFVFCLFMRCSVGIWCVDCVLGIYGWGCSVGLLANCCWFLILVGYLMFPDWFVWGY